MILSAAPSRAQEQRGSSMNFRSVAGRLRRGEFHYALGRFKTVRASYSGLQRLRGMVGQAPDMKGAGRPTLFPNANVGCAVECMHQEAVFLGLRPAAPYRRGNRGVRPLRAVARALRPRWPHLPLCGRRARPCRRRKADAARRHPRAHRAVRPSQAVVEDPVLRAIVRKYLGYEPSRVLTILGPEDYVSDFTDEERRELKHHVIDYHYDVGGFNFVYAGFYITDTDRHSGAHVMMKRSHNHKPLRMLLGSAVASEDVGATAVRPRERAHHRRPRRNRFRPGSLMLSPRIASHPQRPPHARHQIQLMARRRL